MLAAHKAEQLLMPNSAMMLEILEKDDWQYQSGNGTEVYNKLSIVSGRVDVYTYKHWNPRSKVVGKFDGQSIYINMRKKHTYESLVATLLHEYSHFKGFNHFSRTWYGRDNSNTKTEHKCLFSVPYWLSENVGRFL
jgi:hypothetical protein